MENLSIRTIRLRASDGSVHIVPFSSVDRVTNMNRGIGNASISVNVAYHEDTDRVGTVLKDIAAQMRRDPKFKSLIRGDLDLWGIDKFDAAMVTLVGQIECTDAGALAGSARILPAHEAPLSAGADQDRALTKPDRKSCAQRSFLQFCESFLQLREVSLRIIEDVSVRLQIADGLLLASDLGLQLFKLYRFRGGCLTGHGACSVHRRERLPVSQPPAPMKVICR